MGSSYINHFLQPDSIIPDYASPQALNRYSYVTNRPLNFNDPTGHFAFLVPMLVGAGIGAGIDLYVQYQENGGTFQGVNWTEVAISGGIGAAGGLIAAAVIVPGAAIFGAGAASITSSTAIGVATEYATGMFMAGTANVLLSNTQRAATDAVRGEEVTLNSIDEDFRENYLADMGWGIAGYGMGKLSNAIGSKIFNIKNTGVSSVNDYKGRPFLTGNRIQTSIVSSGVVAGEAMSNSTFLDCLVGHSCKRGK